MNDDEATPKKKSDKTADNITVSADKSEAKKDKSDTEEPKPRIVLTFRSEKSNTKTANMKIVSTEEKHEDVSPRRSSRTRGKWDWVCDSDTSISPKKDKSQPVSENDESDSSHTGPKRSRRRSKDYNILASAIARKESFYNEAVPGPTQRSRRIKQKPKILANEEVRIGMEYKNNARPGIQADKSPEEGVRTRRSARPAATDTEKPKVVEKASVADLDIVELDSDSQNSDMKVQHLCKLGLKAITPEEVEPEPEDDAESKELDEEDNESEMLEEDEEEIDDDSEVISKLLEADEDTCDSDEEFLCTVEMEMDERPRRSTRLCSSFGMNDSDRSSPVLEDDSKAQPRRSSRRAGPSLDDSDRSHRSKRKRKHSTEDPALEPEYDEESFPAGGDEGSEAACPTEKSTIIAECFCETPSNFYSVPEELSEPVFCQAIECVDGVRVGCSHAARRVDDGYDAMLRAGPRAPFILACNLHAKQLVNHMCCPACGLFCSQGTFYQCSSGHLFHLECGLPYSDARVKPGCPHCGVYSYRWQPVNTDCTIVKVEMKSSNKRIFLPDQREQCAPAYLGFSPVTTTQVDTLPVIPEDLLPSPKDLKRLCAKTTDVVKCTPQKLCDAILAGETLEHLIPKIMSDCRINKKLPSQEGGTCVHAAARSGHAAALHALHHAGAALSAADNNMRTPAMLAVLALLDKSELRPKDKSKSGKNPEETEVVAKDNLETQEDTSQEGTESKTSMSADEIKAKDEDLLKVIRYLVAAGADVNLPDQPDLMTPLHIAAQHGSVDVCAVLLGAADVDADVRDHGGWTPLMWAAENSHRDVVRLLLAHGASATAIDNEGNSAVHWCALAGAAACLQLLLHHAPHVASAPNKHTDTPLHIAAHQGHYACVIVLLARGARSDIENSAGELPADMCSGQCQSTIALNMHMNALKGKGRFFKLLSSDISNGREQFPIPCINEVDDEPAPMDFTYVTRHVTPQHISVDCTIKSLQGCSCSGGCGAGDAACGCVVLSVREWWRGARLAPTFPYHDPPMLFQCNQTCRCNPKQCGNSVVTRLIEQGSTLVRAQVYRVGGARGWGLRAVARVLRGAPVATYCGELLPLLQADTRADDSYMFALDVKPDLLEQCSDKSQLCVDACHYGSAARFINHSCRPNLTPVRVFTHTRDLRLPTVALFASADVQPGEQFTFDYGDKFWSVKSKWMKCECGSADCRYPTRAAPVETES